MNAHIFSNVLTNPSTSATAPTTTTDHNINHQCQLNPSSSKTTNSIIEPIPSNNPPTTAQVKIIDEQESSIVPPSTTSAKKSETQPLSVNPTSSTTTILNRTNSSTSTKAQNPNKQTSTDPSTSTKAEPPKTINKKSNERQQGLTESENDLVPLQFKEEKYDVVATNDGNEQKRTATYAKVRVNGELIMALIDTGACVTIASEEFAKRIIQDLIPLEKGRHWRAANGGEIEVLGETTVNLELGSKAFDVSLVVARNLSHSLIIGTDVIRENKFIIDFKTNKIRIGNEEVQIEDNNREPRRIVVAGKSVDIEPFSEKTIWRKIPGTRGKTFITEKSGRYGIISSCVTADEDERIPITIVNLSNERMVVKRNTRLCTISAVEIEENRAANTIDISSIASSESSWRPSEMMSLGEDAKIDESQKEELRRLLDRFADVFSKNDEDIGNTDFIHEIKIEGSQPALPRAYQIPYAKREIVEEQVNKMLKMGVISPSESQFSSPIVLVKKHDGSQRFCVDFRNLNASTVKDNFPMPRIQERLDSLSGCKFFTVLDLTAGYWQFKMESESKKWTSFKTHMGVFEFERMPFGLCNAGATFQRAMDSMLRGLNFASAYIDDIMVASKTFEEHLAHLEKVFQRLRNCKLKVKTRKCQFCKSKTKFLGFVVDENGVQVDDEKLKAISEYPTPRTSKQVKQFLGLASYYRRFIPNFADLSEPLNDLTKKSNKFDWTDRCEESFKSLIRALTNPPVLVFPDLRKPFRITTDASGVGIGAILSQLDENRCERVIAYASRTLNKAERNYPTIERELLAIVWATKQYKQYIFGTTFELVTDHKPLTYLKNLGDTSSRIANWKVRLEEFSFSIVYKKGAANTNADVLSRIERDNAEEEVMAVSSEIVQQKVDAEDVRRWQREDEDVNRLKAETEKRGGSYNNYTIDDGILYALKKKVKPYEPQWTKRLVVPEKLKATVLTACHDDMSGAHLGERKTWTKVAGKFFWSKMREDVEWWCRSCAVCAAKNRPRPHEANMKPITEPSRPFEKIGIDFLGPLPKTENGNRYILVLSDYATRWPEAFATSDMKASTVAKILVDEVICRHSAPEELLSDQGRDFLADLIKEVCAYFKVKKINTTAYHPQTNGLTERFNGTLCRMLSAYTEENQRNWDVFLPITLFAYRTSAQTTTKESPFRLLYGRDPRLPSDLEQFCPKTSFVDKLEEAWREAKKNVTNNANEEKGRHDAKFKPLEIRKGDWVRLEAPATKVGLSRKLRRDWFQGPYLVLNTNDSGNVEIEVRKGRKIERKWVHLNRLKKAEEVRPNRSSVRNKA